MTHSRTRSHRLQQATLSGRRFACHPQAFRHGEESPSPWPQRPTNPAGGNVKTIKKFGINAATLGLLLFSTSALAPTHTDPSAASWTPRPRDRSPFGRTRSAGDSSASIRSGHATQRWVSTSSPPSAETWRSVTWATARSRSRSTSTPATGPAGASSMPTPPLARHPPRSQEGLSHPSGGSEFSRRLHPAVRDATADMERHCLRWSTHRSHLGSRRASPARTVN